MEEAKKLEKRKNLEIIVLGFIIVALLGVLIYLLFIKKDNPTEPPKPQDNQQVENNQSQIENRKLYHIEDGEKYTIYDFDGENFISSRQEISFSYPVIDIKDKTIEEINLEIYNQYKEDNDTNLRQVSQEGCIAIKKGDKYYSGEHIIYDSYRIFETNDYLSIVIIQTIDTNCASGGNFYKGYVISKSTKKVMTNEAIIKMFNANEQELINNYNQNADTVGYDKAKNINDVPIYIYENKLATISRGGDLDTLVYYNNGNFENVF